MPRMSQDETDDFLVETGDCTIACLEDDGRMAIVPPPDIYAVAHGYVPHIPPRRARRSRCLHRAIRHGIRRDGGWWK